MSISICGINCDECSFKNGCKGCTETNGCPGEKPCMIAQYITIGGMDAYQEFKKTLIDEINGLKIPGMNPIDTLYPLVGRFVNLEYPLPGGQTAKLLDDDEMYLGAQTACCFADDTDKCFGVIANAAFLLVCQYGENGTNPEILLFKKR